MALIKCSECGADVSEKALQCPKCGCPIEISIDERKSKKQEQLKKNAVKIVVALFIVLLFSIIIIIIGKDVGYYEDYKWGMNYQTVLEKLGKEAIGDDVKKNISIMQTDYRDIEGNTALFLFDCTDDYLQKITIFISIDDTSSNDLKESYIKEFDKLYGENTEETAIAYVWKAKKSQISLINYSKDMIVVEYQDITKIDAE